MISDNILNKAVERGILSPSQVAELHALVQADAPQLAEPEDDEKLRFVSGFSDIFVTLGIGLFAWAVTYFAKLAYGGAAGGIATLIVAWLLAEFFTRRRRMALPSIVLLCLFVAGTYGAANFLIADISGYAPRGWDGFNYDLVLRERPDIIAGAALITMLMAALHYWRFRVPITIAAGAASLAGAAVGLLFTIAPDFASNYVKFIILAAGLAIFVLAMRFDLSDPARVSRRTDIAFWLHLLAAPLIVHPLIANFALQDGEAKTSVALGVLAIFMILGAMPSSSTAAPFWCPVWPMRA